MQCLQKEAVEYKVIKILGISVYWRQSGNG